MSLDPDMERSIGAFPLDEVLIAEMRARQKGTVHSRHRHKPHGMDISDTRAVLRVASGYAGFFIHIAAIPVHASVEGIKRARRQIAKPLGELAFVIASAAEEPHEGGGAEPSIKDHHGHLDRGVGMLSRRAPRAWTGLLHGGFLAGTIDEQSAVSIANQVGLSFHDHELQIAGANAAPEQPAPPATNPSV